jgi:ketosteroid isomerase-like protein
MAEHPNVARLREGYVAFGKGDFAGLNELFAEDIVWHVTGRNQLSGDYRGREAVYGMFGRLMQITEGSFRLDTHSILADDEHGVALVRSTAHRGDKSLETRDTHVFHLSDGRVTEFWGASTDPYAIDDFMGQ